MDSKKITCEDEASRDVEKRKGKTHRLVMENYAEIARGEIRGCAPSCCDGSTPLITIMGLGKALDYAEEDLLLAPGEVKRILSELGFQEIAIRPKEQSEKIIQEWNIAEGAEKVVFSAYIQAGKPGQIERKGNE